MLFTIAQILGIVSLICYLISTQHNEKKKILFWMTGVATASAVQYLLLGGVSGCIANIIPIFRNLTYNRFKKVPTWVIGFYCILTFLFGLLFYTGPISLLPVLQTIIYTIFLGANNLTHFRLIQIASASFMIAYNVSIGAWTALLLVLAQVIFAIVGVIRFDSEKIKKLLKNSKRKKNR